MPISIYIMYAHIIYTQKFIVLKNLKLYRRPFLLYTVLPAQIVQTSTTTSSLYLQWTRNGGDTIILYYWKTSTPSNVSTVTTTSLSYNITGLDSNTAYKVIVSARTSVESANSSEVAGYTTPEGICIYDFAWLALSMYIELRIYAYSWRSGHTNPPLLNIYQCTMESSSR